MRQDVSITVDVKWPVERVGAILGGPAEVLFGQRPRPLDEPATDFSHRLQVPVGLNGTVGYPAIVHVSRGVVGPHGAREVRVVPAGRTHFLPAFRGTVAASAHGGWTRLVLDGAATVPFGILLHHGRGRRSLEQSLTELVESIAANVDAELTREAKAEARRAALPIGSDYRHDDLIE